MDITIVQSLAASKQPLINERRVSHDSALCTPKSHAKHVAPLAIFFAHRLEAS